MQLIEKFDPFFRPGSGRLEGLVHYASDGAAIIGEDCNDALHILYARKLEDKAKQFLTGFQGRCLYAIKANPHPAVIQFLWKMGVRQFEMASLREIEYISKLLPEAELFFMHPIKSRQAIRIAYQCGVRNFAFDSLEELKKIECETGYAEDLSLFLRVRVDQESAAHPLSGKFGATFLETPRLLRRAQKSSKKLGITFHVGSQCMDPGDYRTALQQVAEIIRCSEVAIDQLDIGGGFPVPYPGMQPVDLDDYFSCIHQAIDDFDLNDLDILCEPGRALVAEAGAVAVRVEMRKGQTLYLNDGTYGTLFDAGVPGWSYPLQVIGRSGDPLQGAVSPFKLYGPTCDSLDTMEGPFELANDIAEGDWVLFQNLGAYGYAMQTRFNGFYTETTVSVD